MACCQDKLSALAAVESDIYPVEFDLTPPGGPNFYVTSDGALTIVDVSSMTSDNFECSYCGFENYLQLYNQPTLFVSRDESTKYPVKAHKKMLNPLGFAQIYQYNEQNFNTFINGWYYQHTGAVTKFIIYCPMKNIHSHDRNIPVVIIDDKVAVCLILHDGIILINSDCEVLESEPGIYNIPGGYLECVGDIIN